MIYLIWFLWCITSGFAVGWTCAKHKVKEKGLLLAMLGLMSANVVVGIILFC